MLAKSRSTLSQREDLAKLREAVEMLAVRNAEGRNYEVEWKFAKYNYFLGKQTESKKKRKKYSRTACRQAKSLRGSKPDKPDGYFWYAANLGEQAKQKPGHGRYHSLHEIRAAINKVIEIDPRYQGATAFDALGQSRTGRRNNRRKTGKSGRISRKSLTSKKTIHIWLHLAQAYSHGRKRGREKAARISC